MNARRTSLRVALGQIRVDAGRTDANLAAACAAIQVAATAGAEVIVLPECLEFGWGNPQVLTGAEPIPGPRTGMLAAAAGEAGIVVAAGLGERDGRTIHNSAILVERDGTLVGRHRKINELDFARALYTPGGSLQVFDTSIGRVGLAICADLLDAALGEALGSLGARIILSPSAWAVPDDHDESATPYGAEWRAAYGGIAARFGVAVAAASNVGRIASGAWAGRRVIGRSLAVHGDGSVAGAARFDAADLLLVDVRLH